MPKVADPEPTYPSHYPLRNIVAEMRVLGALLLGNSEMREALLPMLNPANFQGTGHGELLAGIREYAAALPFEDVWEVRELHDLLTVRGIFGGTISLGYLFWLTELVDSGSSVEDTLREAHVLCGDRDREQAEKQQQQRRAA